jgi:hypothetical protein
MPDRRSNASTPQPPQLLSGDSAGLPSPPTTNTHHPMLYESKDVYSQPPTTIVIRLRGCDDEAAGSVVCDRTRFLIDESEVEETAGFQQRFAKPQQLTVCFNHSFGKCTGRTGTDPATCQQLHIRRQVLDALRQEYKYERRTFMSRTVKAFIPNDLKAWLYAATRGKSGSMLYFEFMTSDVRDTEGLRSFETAFREWLLHDPHLGSQASSRSPTKVALAPPAPTQSGPFRCDNVLLCSRFNFTQHCDDGAACKFIHADLSRAMTRDPVIAQALEHLAHFPRDPALVSPPLYHSRCPAYFSSVEARRLNPKIQQGKRLSAVAAVWAPPQLVALPEPPKSLRPFLRMGSQARQEELGEPSTVDLVDLLRRVAALEPFSPLAHYATPSTSSTCFGRCA